MSNEKKNDGGPAYPGRVILEDKLGGVHESTNPGMSLRDHFAGLAMQGMRSSKRYMDAIAEESKRSGYSMSALVAKWAFVQSDEMLRAREQ